jgi:hypothetical protein
LYRTSNAASSGETLTVKGDSCQEIPDRLKDRIYARGILLALVRDGSLPLTEANANLAGMGGRRYRSPADHLDELI